MVALGLLFLPIRGSFRSGPDYICSPYTSGIYTKNAAHDKAEHFVFCAVISSVTYSLARRYSNTYRYRLLLGALAGALAGLLKEVGDLAGWWPGVWSSKDLAADIVGTVVALAILVGAEAKGLLKAGTPHRPAEI
eukprot:jgi/Botrbrau1/15005/Bobra.0018s0104.1